MQILNPESASRYMDAVRGERQRGAVLAVHLAWLEHSSSPGRGERLEPKTPLDLLVLYQAAAAAFEDGPPSAPPGVELAAGGRVVNRKQATQRLQSVADEEVRLLAASFARHVIALSSTAASEQDLDYYVALFLKGVGDKKVIESISSGAVTKNSAQLSDPDLW